MTEQIFFCTVEPRQYNEGLKGLEKFVRYNEVLLSRFFFIYFTITGVKKNHSLYRGLRYIEVPL